MFQMQCDYPRKFKFRLSKLRLPYYRDYCHGKELAELGLYQQRVPEELNKTEDLLIKDDIRHSERRLALLRVDCILTRRPLHWRTIGTGLHVPPFDTQFAIVRPVVTTVQKDDYYTIEHIQGKVEFSTVTTYEPLEFFPKFDTDEATGSIYISHTVANKPEKDVEIFWLRDTYIPWYKSTQPFKLPKLGRRGYPGERPGTAIGWVKSDIEWNLREFLPKNGKKILKKRTYPIGIEAVIVDTFAEDTVRLILQYAGIYFDLNWLGRQEDAILDSKGKYRWLRGLPHEDIDKKDQIYLFVNDSTEYTGTDHFNFPYNLPSHRTNCGKTEETT
jgi:hypothetical protein